MDTAHTPGPWDHNIGPRYPIYTRKGHRKVAAALYGGSAGVPEEEAKANMRLISAAPDMLAALQYFVELYDSNPATWPDDDAEALRLATAAVARATGERID